MTTTDDADCMIYGCDTFDTDSHSDYDPMHSDDFNPHAPQHDNKPSGWGFDRFENADVYRIMRELRVAGPGLLGTDTRGPEWFAVAVKWSGHNTKLEACSDRLWERLCDRCETHAEAVEKYTRWAEKVKSKVA